MSLLKYLHFPSFTALNGYHRDKKGSITGLLKKKVKAIDQA